MLIESIFEKYFNISDPVDRYTYPQYSLFKLPNLKNNKLVSLEDCITDQIKKISHYDNIYLLWSGGIDSTFVFYALVLNKIKFSVVMTNNSKIEYPFLFEKIINKKYDNVDYFLISSFEEINLSNNSIVLTGECGDQLVGSSVYSSYYIKQLNETYKNILPDDFLFFTENTVINFFNDIDPFNNNISLSEFLYAVNFIFKYDNVNKRINKDFEKRYNKKINFFHFFESELFQTWSIQNYKLNTKFKSHNDYKLLYKTFIYNINKDENYLKNKRKVGSLYMSGLT